MEVTEDTPLLEISELEKVFSRSFFTSIDDTVEPATFSAKHDSSWLIHDI